jgi:hypothetical protein
MAWLVGVGTSLLGKRREIQRGRKFSGQEFQKCLLRLHVVSSPRFKKYFSNITTMSKRGNVHLKPSIVV